MFRLKEKKYAAKPQICLLDEISPTEGGIDSIRQILKQLSEELGLPLHVDTSLVACSE